VSTPLPTRVGKYEILDRIAIGGMAELYKARIVGEAGFEKLVAIKRILPHLAQDAGYVEMFLDEARLCARLEHPNIVAAYELGTDGGAPFIAMQYVEGIDVLDLLRECVRTGKRIPPGLAAFICRQVLDALDYAHTLRDAAGRPQHVVHRDVSPGNVLVSWRGDVKLTDFGIARASEHRHRTESGLLKGKYGYMSPEQVMGAELDGRSDLFSVGVVLAEMVMARRLFSAPRELDALVMVRDARLDRLHAHATAFPLPLRVALIRALQKRPDDRWHSARDFRAALDEWLATLAPRVGPAELAEFIGQVLDAPDLPGSASGSVPVVAPAAAEPGAPVTPRPPPAAATTAAHRSSRRAFITGDSHAVPQPIGAEPSTSIIIEDSDLAGEASAPHHAPTERGRLAETPMVALLYRLARAGSTGLLICNHPSGVIKEAWFEGGQPMYVNSTDPRERLGQFLIAEGIITAAELEQAIAAAPGYGGRLSDALVGLHLVSPLDAYRQLAKQVGNKLIAACAWPDGVYAWIPGEANPWKARPLHLDPFRIIGAGCTQLDLPMVDAWAARNAHTTVTAVGAAPDDLERFGLGEALRRVHGLLAHGATLAELLAQPRSIDGRANLLRLLYLLVHTGHARLGAAPAS
jgi:serine/threonine protein kinase